MQISRCLNFGDIKSLSGATRRFREQLSPRLYRTIRFTNRSADGEDITRVVSKHGAYATRLHFDFCLAQDTEILDDDEETAPDGDLYRPGDESGKDRLRPATELPEFTSRLLSGESLPGASLLRINFIPSEEGFWGLNWGDRDQLGGFYIFQDVVPPYRLESEEQRWPSWRRIVAKMWRVLSRNENITTLETEGLPAMPVSSWLHEDWSTFLGRLDTLILRIWGGSSGTGTHANTARGFIDFLNRLGTHFFKHAKNLKELHLVADPDNFYGESDAFTCEIALRQGQMPKLRELHVHHCFIDESLCKYLIAATSAEVLKKLHLIDCMSNEEIPSWAELFTRLATTDFMGLEELVVANKEVELPSDHEVPEYLQSVEVRNEFRGTLFVYSGPELDTGHKRHFSYGTVDDSEGTIYADEERTADEFESGDDMTAYRQLMKIVEENRERGAAEVCEFAK